MNPALSIWTCVDTVIQRLYMLQPLSNAVEAKIRGRRVRIYGSPPSMHWKDAVSLPTIRRCLHYHRHQLHKELSHQSFSTARRVTHSFRNFVTKQ